MGWGKAGNHRAQVALSQPLRQALFKYALPGAPYAGDYDNSARALHLSHMEKAAECSAAGYLVVSVQVQYGRNFQLAAAHPLLSTAVLRRRGGGRPGARLICGRS